MARTGVPWVFARPGRRERVMSPTSQLVGVPPVGFRPTTRHLTCGSYNQVRSHSGTLPVLRHGAIRRTAQAAVIRDGPRTRQLGSEQRSSHPTLPVQHRVYLASLGMLGLSLLSPPGAASAVVSRVRGSSATARVREPVSTADTTMTDLPTHTHTYRIISKPSPNQSAGVHSTPDVLSPSRDAVGCHSRQR